MMSIPESKRVRACIDAMEAKRDYEKLAASLAPIDVLADIMAAHNARLRERLLKIPAQAVGPVMACAGDVAVVEAAIQRVVVAALSDLVKEAKAKRGALLNSVASDLSTSGMG